MSILGVTLSNKILFYFSLYPRATLGISARNPYMLTKKNELIEVLLTLNLDGHPLLDPVDTDQEETDSYLRKLADESVYVYCIYACECNINWFDLKKGSPL